MWMSGWKTVWRCCFRRGKTCRICMSLMYHCVIRVPPPHCQWSDNNHPFLWPVLGNHDVCGWTHVPIGSSIMMPHMPNHWTIWLSRILQVNNANLFKLHQVLVMLKHLQVSCVFTLKVTLLLVLVMPQLVPSSGHSRHVASLQIKSFADPLHVCMWTKLGTRVELGRTSDSVRYSGRCTASLCRHRTDLQISFWNQDGICSPSLGLNQQNIQYMWDDGTGFYLPQRSNRSRFEHITPWACCSNHSQWVEKGNNRCNNFHPSGNVRPLHHLCARLISLGEPPRVHQDKVRHSVKI